MAVIEFDPQARDAYALLEKAAGSGRLLDAIDDALDLLEADPGDGRVRRRSFRDGLWGVPVRDRSEDWLIIWEQDPDDADVVIVRYLGADPFA
ncbi:type II toxin-antitoxin system RelE/ParE family toxin [Planomonospora algeriensis]